MNNEQKLNNKGFSLIELLVSIAIAGIVVVAAFSMVLYGMNRYAKSSKETKLQNEIQFVNNAISDAIKEGHIGSSRIDITRKADGSVNTAMIYTALQLDSNGLPVEVSGKIQCLPGSQKIYYNSTKHSVFIYDANETVGTGDDNHLVSDCVYSFDVGYAKAANSDVVGVNSNPDPSSGVETYFHESRLMKFTIKFKVSSIERTSENTYKMRNK